MKHTARTMTPSQIEALRASIVLGLVRLLAAIGEIVTLPRALRDFCSDLVWDAERNAQAVICLLAFRRFTPRARRVMMQRPRSVALGFRLKRTRAPRGRRFRRNALRNIRRGTLMQRIARVIAAMRDPDRHIARVLKHLAAGLFFGALVATAPPAITHTPSARTAMIVSADTS